jgi:hypothetical protein
VRFFSQCAWGPTPTRCDLARSRSVAAAGATALVTVLLAAIVAPRRATVIELAAQERDDRGALAILRRDGVLFPFASFNRDNWQITWPIDLTKVAIPANLGAIPKRWWGTVAPEHWRVHLTNGAEATVDVSAPVLFPMFCAKRIGAQTNYRASQPLPPNPVDPYPKDGLAITGRVPIDSIESVNPASPEFAAMATLLHGHVNEVEEQTVVGVQMRTGWKHPLGMLERSMVPIKLESWYRSPSSEPGWTVSYIEAVRQFPPGPADKGCGLETLVSGWLHDFHGVLKKADLRGKLTYCDRDGATYMLPLGRIRPWDRWYWVFQLSGYDTEWYDVAEVARERTRLVLEVYAGDRKSCPQ